MCYCEKYMDFSCILLNSLCGLKLDFCLVAYELKSKMSCLLALDTKFEKTNRSYFLLKKVSPNENIGRYLDCVSKGIDEFRYDRMWHWHTRVMIEFIYIITSVISLSFISSMNCHRRWLPLFRFFFSLVRMWRIFFAFILVCSGPRVWFSEISSFFPFAQWNILQHSNARDFFSVIHWNEVY